mmetsp:Transcript_34374/g.65688  ORF Transcript_34374/g.65688 Transcript_34374/m.65688 type:complete len:595 (-) Transcript_34374:216-2000(-)
MGDKEKEDKKPAFWGVVPTGAELREIERKVRGYDSTNPWSVRNRLKATLCRLPVPERRTRTDLIEITALASTACKFMAQHPVEKRFELCKNVVLETYKKGAVICKQGDVGLCYYAIVTGTLAVMLSVADLMNPALAATMGEVSKDGKLVKADVMTKGNGFGEMSLITNKPRAANIVAESNSELLVIDKDTYLRCFQRDEGNFPIILNFLQNHVRALRYVDKAAIHNMANYCSLVKFNKDQTFYPDEGATINVIVDGSASVCTPPSTDHETVKQQATGRVSSITRTAPLRSRCKKLATLESGSFFGESCACEELQKGWIVFVDNQITCVQISKTFYSMHLDQHLIKAINTESIFRTGYIQGRNRRPASYSDRSPDRPARKGGKGSAAGEALNLERDRLPRESYAGLFYTPPPPPPPWTGIPKAKKPPPPAATAQGGREKEVSSQEKLEALGLSLLEGVFPSRYPRALPKLAKDIRREQAKERLASGALSPASKANSARSNGAVEGTAITSPDTGSEGKNWNDNGEKEMADADVEDDGFSNQKDPPFSRYNICRTQGAVRRIRAELTSSLDTVRSAAFGLDAESETWNASSVVLKA